MQSAFEGRDGRGVHIGFYRLGHERGNIEGGGERRWGRFSAI
jgi:hypothetical protein